MANTNKLYMKYLNLKRRNINEKKRDVYTFVTFILLIVADLYPTLTELCFPS